MRGAASATALAVESTLADETRKSLTSNATVHAKYDKVTEMTG